MTSETSTTSASENPDNLQELGKMIDLTKLAESIKKDPQLVGTINCKFYETNSFRIFEFFDTMHPSIQSFNHSFGHTTVATTAIPIVTT